MNKKKKSSLMLRTLKKMLGNKLAMAGLVIFIIMVLAAAAAPLITRYDPSALDLTSIAKPPGAEHWFGTDKLGRDVFTQVIYGGRVSIYVGVVGALLGAAIGMVLGCIAGFFGGKVDALIVRASELFLTFPNMILILMLASLFGQSVNNIVLIFAFTGWMTTFRMVRNEFLSLREETYVLVCRAFGIPSVSIMFRHILPNILSPIFISLTLNVAGYILQEASLSFLGLGVPVTTPTWGNIMNAAKSLDVIANNWWLWFFPGVAISLFVMATNFLGDGLRDVLDPRQ